MASQISPLRQRMIDDMAFRNVVTEHAEGVRICRWVKLARRLTHRDRFVHDTAKNTTLDEALTPWPQSVYKPTVEGVR